jgi:hypothetical protein
MKHKVWWVSACYSSFCLFLLIWTVSGQKAKVSRTAWEYQMIIVPRVSDQARNIMNQNGTEGWELVQVRFPGADGGDLVLIFKRPK